MRIVLTGPPGSGKSSVLEGLADSYPIIPEAARSVFTNYAEYCKDKKFAQCLIEETQYRQFLDNEHGIFDRGMPDQHAYRNHYGMAVPPLISSRCYVMRYDMVFFFPFWRHIYVTDDVRKEDEVEALQIAAELEQIYRTYSYRPISVPFVSVYERVMFIHEEIAKFLKQKEDIEGLLAQR